MTLWDIAYGMLVVACVLGILGFMGARNNPNLRPWVRLLGWIAFAVFILAKISNAT